MKTFITVHLIQTRSVSAYRVPKRSSEGPESKLSIRFTITCVASLLFMKEIWFRMQTVQITSGIFSTPVLRARICFNYQDAGCLADQLLSRIQSTLLCYLLPLRWPTIAPLHGLCVLLLTSSCCTQLNTASNCCCLWAEPGESFLGSWEYAGWWCVPEAWCSGLAQDSWMWAATLSSILSQQNCNWNKAPDHQEYICSFVFWGCEWNLKGAGLQGS